MKSSTEKMAVGTRVTMACIPIDCGIGRIVEVTDVPVTHVTRRDTVTHYHGYKVRWAAGTVSPWLSGLDLVRV